MKPTLMCRLRTRTVLWGALAVWAVQFARGDYDGTGTFTKITSRAELTDGYYVIASSNGLAAMTHTNAGTFFTSNAVSPSADVLTDPSPAIVWLIQTNATYGGHTLFNEASNRYVAYAGTANAAYSVGAVNGTTGVWTFVYGAGAFDVANVAIGTRILQYNAAAPRFACYATAQQKLALYKMEETAESAPEFGANPGPVAATATMATAFTVTASGNPDPVLTLESATAAGGSYAFTSASGLAEYTPPAGDVGTQSFTFSASNHLGAAMQTVTVSVAEAPVTIPTVSVTNIGTNSFTVHWTEVTGATTYQVQVATDTNFTPGVSGGGLFISQYYEGAGNDKWIELYNASESALDLSAEGLRIGIWANAAREAWKTGTAPNSSIPLAGTLVAGGIYLVQNSSAVNPTYATADLSSGSLTFNGDDSVVLYAGATYSTGAIVDSIGLTGTTHADTSIVRKSSILSGNTAATDLIASEWDAVAYTAVDAATAGHPERLGEHAISGGTGGSLVVDGTVSALTTNVTSLDMETTYFIRVRATDGIWSDAVTATTAGSEASAPVFTGGAGPYAITAGELLDFTVSAIGTPTPVLALSAATAQAADYAFEPATGYFLYEPPLADGGTTQTFTFTASNTEGVATQAVTVTVSIPATRPTIDPLSPLTLEAGETTNVWIVARETDGDVMTLTASNLPANATFTPVSGTGAVSNQFSFSPSSNQAGQVYSVVFYAGDADGTHSATLEITVPGNDPWTEYYASCYTNGALKTGIDLKNALHDIIDGHTSVSYDGAINILRVIDECPTNSSMVQLLYLQHGRDKYNFGNNPGQWNREHVWANSHGINDSLPAYSDVHHLHPADVTVNQTRGDKDFDTVSGLSNTYSYNSTSFEPPDAAKGDVARAMFYMAVRYDGSDGVGDLELTNAVSTSGAWHGKLDTLMDWHELDPVDDYEIRRNNLIYSDYQGNRNPFVDRPEWVRVVFDTNYLALPTLTEFTAEPNGTDRIDVGFSFSGTGDGVVIVWDGDGTFDTPTGTAPAVGQPFAGGTVLYKGSRSPQSHTGLSPCQTVHYQCWAYVGTNYAAGGMTASATTAGPDAPASAWAAATNATDFTAAWSGVSGVTDYVLDVATGEGFTGMGDGWRTIFRETMGTSAGTVTLADHEAADGFDNDVYTMSDGGAENPADIRSSSASSGYMDSAGNLASSNANVYFTATGVTNLGFAIEGIDTTGCEALALSFGYRKEDGAANMSLGVEWSTNCGAVWNTVTVSNLPAEGAAVGWYMISNLTVSTAALDSTNLSLRWTKNGGVAGRIDDVLLQGYQAEALFVPGYSNRAVSGATSVGVTGLTAGATYYFRVGSVPNCEVQYSPVGVVTTLGQFTEPLTPFQEWLAGRDINPTNSLYAEDADYDEDGATTYEEYLADTDPTSAGSVLALDGTYYNKTQTGGETGEMRFTFPASSARYYQLLYSADLSATLTNNLGWGVPDMVVTNAYTGTWFGTLRVLLNEP